MIKVDGSWSTWKDWAVCSASCDGGTRTRQRECLFPKDRPHGENCTGSIRENDSCNEAACPSM